MHGERREQSDWPCKDFSTATRRLAGYRILTSPLLLQFLFSLQATLGNLLGVVGGLISYTVVSLLCGRSFRCTYTCMRTPYRWCDAFWRLLRRRSRRSSYGAFTCARGDGRSGGDLYAFFLSSLLEGKDDRGGSLHLFFHTNRPYNTPSSLHSILSFSFFVVSFLFMSISPSLKVSMRTSGGDPSISAFWAPS